MPERRYEFAEIMQARGFPAPDDAIMRGLRDVVDEGVLGASNHVALALPLVARAAEVRRETARDEALELARFISRTRGVGAPIVANALAWQTAGIEDLPADEAVAELQRRAEAWSSAAAERRQALVEKGANELSGCRTPLIYDYSSTVVDLVRTLAGRGGLTAVIIPESRAIDGGRRYMAALADLGLSMIFLPDAALEYAVSQAEAVLLGAESVTCDGGIVNTIGSTMAARGARAHGVPVYGAADLFKVGARPARDLPAARTRRYDFLLKANEAASTEAPELEVVPPELVTAVLTEAGPVAPADLLAAMSLRAA